MDRKFSIITCTDGNNVVRAEGTTDLESAKKIISPLVRAFDR